MEKFNPKNVVEIKIIAIDSNGKRWELTPKDHEQEIQDIFYPEDYLQLFDSIFDYTAWYKITGPFTQPKEDFPAGVPPVKD